MAAEITREELLLLGRCPFFRGADEALLRRVLALPGVTAEAFPAGGPSTSPTSSAGVWAFSWPVRCR